MSEEKLTLGQYFRRERENRGIELKDIEKKTKISAQTLRFLEEDQIDMLPPRAFLRGFLQVISKEFDFDEEELVKYLDETLAAFGRPEEPVHRFRSQDKAPFPRLLIIVAVIFIAIVVFGISMKKCSSPVSPQTSVGAGSSYIHEESPNAWTIDNYPS